MADPGRGPTEPTDADDTATRAIRAGGEAMRSDDVERRRRMQQLAIDHETLVSRTDGWRLRVRRTTEPQGAPPLPTTADPGERRAAENEALFRAVNERIEELHEVLLVGGPLTYFVCECSDSDCCAQIALTTDEYERLREGATYFAVLPDARHARLEYERIVETNDRYWVVEKLGVAGAVAAELDPR
jgi:hypothetical protein